MVIEGCPLIQKFGGHFKLEEGPNPNFFVYLPTSEIIKMGPETIRILLTTCGDCLKCSSHSLVTRQFSPLLLNEGNFLGILTPGFADPSLTSEQPAEQNPPISIQNNS